MQRTLEEFFAAGHREAMQLAESEGVAPMLRRASISVLQFRINWAVRGANDLHTVHTHRGSAFALGATTVVSAGHGLYDSAEAAERIPGFGQGLDLVDTSGAQVHVRHAHYACDRDYSGPDDWAVLWTTDHLGVPAFVASVALPEDVLFVLGFPAGFGLDNDGVVRDDHPALQPLVAAVDASSLIYEHNRIKARLIAGTAPVPGSSGGPIVDREGHVVGIQTGHSLVDATGESLVDFVPVSNPDFITTVTGPPSG